MPARPATVALLLVLLAGSAAAAIAVTTTASVSVGVRAPPVAFELGSGASHARYVSGAEVSPNGTSFSVSASGRLGGDSTVKSLMLLTSVASGPRAVTLHGTQVTNANIPIHTWTVRSGSATIATLDMRAASPTVSFELPAGATYEMDMRVKVLKGAASSQSSFETSVWAVVS